jgi:hypothetical protein
VVVLLWKAGWFWHKESNAWSAFFLLPERLLSSPKVHSRYGEGLFWAHPEFAFSCFFFLLLAVSVLFLCPVARL